jgi:hypothetical protein
LRRDAPLELASVTGWTPRPGRGIVIACDGGVVYSSTIRSKPCDFHLSDNIGVAALAFSPTKIKEITTNDVQSRDERGLIKRSVSTKYELP